MATVTKRTRDNGTVSYRATDYIYDPVSGKRKVITKDFPTKKEAQAHLAQMHTAINQGTFITNNPTTFGQVLDEWLDGYAAAKVRPKTLYDYRYTINKYIKPMLAGIPLQKLTARHIELFYQHMRNTKHGGRILQLCQLRISQVLDWAVKRDLVGQNVADRVETPTYEPQEVSTWTIEQIKTFLSTCDKECTYGQLWRVSLYTGVRRGELLGLRWQDIDLVNKVIHVRQAVTLLGGHALMGPLKTKNSLRDIPLVDALVPYIEKQRLFVIKLRDEAFEWTDQDLVFPARNGNPINPNNAAREYGRLVKLAGLPRIKIHALRHTHASISLQAGADMSALSKNLGHSKVSITSDIYAHVSGQMQRDASNKISEALE